MQTWTFDLVIWCPSMEEQTTSWTWGKSPVLGMVVARGWSVTIALEDLLQGVQ